jgi:cell wall-associated NlpC family hydrolase
MATKQSSGSSLPGFWLVAGDATVTAHGDAAPLSPNPLGSAPASPARPASRVVAAVASADGGGYWLAYADGTVVAFGDAGFAGDAPSGGLTVDDIVGMAATPDGGGYWLVGADGGVFSFGDAAFHGSLPSASPAHAVTGHPARMVGMAPSMDGGGYWLVGADGGVFSFGDAAFHGSAGRVHLNRPVVAVAATVDGGGYWLVGADGGVFGFGDAVFAGSATGAASAAAVVGISPTFDGGGYWVARADGRVAAFGDAPTAATPLPPIPASTGATATAAAPPLAPIVAIVASGRLVPSDYVNWTHQAAASCPGLSWTVLAAIAKVESGFGRSTLPGVQSGSNSAGAEGPMQFLPTTFAGYDHPVRADRAATPASGVTPASPYDPIDAVWAAARMLCANGGAHPQTLSRAVFAYNHAGWYVNQVEALAASYQPQTRSASRVARAALAAAESQFGVAYLWGGESPGEAFDCSGLVQWAYRSAGVDLPRTSQTQWAALPHLPSGAALQPGDLVFFAGSDGTMTAPGHVGIYLGDGQMINAPYTGTVVRVDTIDWTDYVGAARPADLRTFS